MVIEQVPADIRAQGGVARMSDPGLIREEFKNAVTIPVMAKARIGHFVEAQILETIGVIYGDESEVLTPADEEHHINKHNFMVPFVCGCRNLGEAIRRIREGAAMIRTKGEAGTGNIVEAVRHVRSLMEVYQDTFKGLLERESQAKYEANEAKKELIQNEEVTRACSEVESQKALSTVVPVTK